MKNIMSEIVANTRRLAPGYFENTCAQRIAGGAGSCFDGFDSVEQLEAAFLAASWEPAEHPEIAPGCRGFVTRDIPGGKFGLIRIADLPDDAVLVADDRKHTGTVSMTVPGALGAPVAETWAIVGPESGENVLFTFHPGEPVRPSLVTTSEVAHGTTLSKAEALRLGFDLAKVV